jgi:dsRNA-specific ribonuclease
MLQSENREGKTSLADESAVEKLMEYVRSKKLSGPGFYDLGEDESSTPECPKFKVACKMGEFSATGEGMSKKNARYDSAAKLLKILKGDSEEKKKSGAKKSTRPKQNIRKAKNKT